MDGSQRYLIVTADDYGIGPATSQGILELAAQQRVTAAVLLVNSPFADQAVRRWRQAGRPMELGWHPCLTLDQPVLPAQRVPSLVDHNGRFFSLGRFLKRLLTGQVRAAEIEAEFRAQCCRFHDLVGHVPTLVNSHHHVQVFPPVGAVLRKILARHQPLAYMRRVREPWRVLVQVPGARKKRLCLSTLGRWDAHCQQRDGFPGNDWLAGITDSPCVSDPHFLTRWLTCLPGDVVELTCHPGHQDRTLIGRDCTPTDGQLQRRVDEYQLLRRATFVEACRQAGFTLVAPSEWRSLRVRAHAA